VITFQILPRVIAWGIEAAREHVELARFHGEIPDPEPTMGLRQSFDAEFNFKALADKDLLLNSAFDAYRATVRTFSEWNPPGYEPPPDLRAE